MLQVIPTDKFQYLCAFVLLMEGNGGCVVCYSKSPYLSVLVQLKKHWGGGWRMCPLLQDIPVCLGPAVESLKLWSCVWRYQSVASLTFARLSVLCKEIWCWIFCVWILIGRWLHRPAFTSCFYTPSDIDSGTCWCYRGQSRCYCNTVSSILGSFFLSKWLSSGRSEIKITYCLMRKWMSRE